MFNISFAECIVILLLAFLILGPDEMVKIARFLGRAVRKCRGLLYKIKEYVNDEAADSGLDEIKKVADEIKDVQSSVDIRKDLKRDLLDETKGD
ncbi:MAG: twin-arginine translocase TatA/TatE family subunit [Firmicutes bacterium]|nr:twin-arginine translocase TatA/TatE family subunit [Bacillota bacterium]